MDGTEMTRHLSDKPCRNGHVPTYRFDSNNACVECQREHQIAYRLKKGLASQPMLYKAALVNACKWHEDELQLLARSSDPNPWYVSEHTQQIDLINKALEIKK
jgi:hypothetical protein